MTNLASPEQDRLRALDDVLEEWKVRVLQYAQQADSPGDDGDIDDVYAKRFKQTLGRLVALNEQLHPDDFDPATLAEIRDIIIKWIAALEDFDPSRPLDSVDYFLVHAEAIRHLVRDALDAHVDGVGDDAQTVVATLQSWLPEISQAKLAELVGISTRQLQRWKKEGGKPTRRLRTVARLVAILRRAWTDDGVIAWFYRARHDLDGKRPIDLLDSPEFDSLIGTAARQGRAEHGA